MPDTELAAPRKPEPTVDPRVLGHLLLVQSTLHVMPRAEGIAAFVCRGVTSVPGIGAAGLCLQGVLRGQSDGFPAAACEAALCGSGSSPAGPGITEALPCLGGHEHWIRLGFQTLSRRFGWLLLIVESKEDSAPYLPHLQNLANVAAMTLESREHQAQLEHLNANLRLHAAEAEEARVQLAAAHQGLEEKIRVRTAELAMVNRTLMEEIQERRAAEAASKESGQRLRLAQQAAHLGMWDWDFATGHVCWSEGQAALYGFPAGTEGASIQQIREKVLPEDLASTIEITNLAIRERLLQSQKMEGLGRLAGGVAHDINNMLGVMFAHLDLLEVKLPPDSPLSDHLREMGKAAERSRDIVRQLLAFSRKEVIQPKVLILEDRIGDTLKALAALLVEDNETLRNVILSMLQGLGYEVLAADSPQHALDICQRRGEEVDLLLTDLVMPGMSGTELRDQILVMRPSLQVLFMSGYTGDVITRMGMLEGASQFLQKPFSRQELSRKITQAMAGV